MVAVRMERRPRVSPEWNVIGLSVRFVARTWSSSVREGSTGPRWRRYVWLSEVSWLWNCGRKAMEKPRLMAEDADGGRVMVVERWML